jgi:hypothetical protein
LGFQERLLSPRSVYFDHQLHWECSELLACEYHPDGVPREDVERPLLYVWGNCVPLRLNTLIIDARYVTQKRRPAPADVWSSQYQSWMQVVKEFSHCKLTYESDCLLALSGLAKYFAQEFDDKYLAGMWEKDLFVQLLWHCDVDPRLWGDRRTSPRRYLGMCLRTF